MKNFENVFDEWKHRRDLFKMAVGETYETQIEPYRQTIRKMCGTIIPARKALIALLEQGKKLPDEKVAAIIAAAYDVHQEQSP